MRTHVEEVKEIQKKIMILEKELNCEFFYWKGKLKGYLLAVKKELEFLGSLTTEMIEYDNPNKKKIQEEIADCEETLKLGAEE